jgi:hypothetical protein
MTPRRLKIDPNKQHCDRCSRKTVPIYECSFTFREPLAYWKAIWERRTGLRLTRKRQQMLGTEWEFDWKSPPTFWMDLCPTCWEDCSKPWDGFPMEFWEQVLRLPAVQPANAPTTKNLVPTKTVPKPVRTDRGAQAALAL